MATLLDQVGKDYIKFDSIQTTLELLLSLGLTFLQLLLREREINFHLTYSLLGPHYLQKNLILNNVIFSESIKQYLLLYFYIPNP